MNSETHSLLKVSKLSTDLTYDIVRPILERAYYKSGYSSFEEFLQSDSNRCAIANLRASGRRCTNGSKYTRNGTLISGRQWRSMYAKPLRQSHVMGDQTCDIPRDGALRAIDVSLACMLILNVRSLAEQNEDILDDLRTVLDVRQDITSFSVLEVIHKEPYDVMYKRLHYALHRMGAKVNLNKTPEIQQINRIGFYHAHGNPEKFSMELAHGKLTVLTVHQGHRTLVNVLKKCIHQAGFNDIANMLNNRHVLKEIQNSFKHKSKVLRHLSQVSFTSLIDNKESCWKTLGQIDENLAVHLLKKLNIFHMEILSKGSGKIPKHVETIRRLRAKLCRNSNSSTITEVDFRKEWISLTSAILQLSRFHEGARNDSLVHEMSSVLNTSDLIKLMNSIQRKEPIKQNKQEFFRVHFDNPPEVLNAYEYTRTKAGIVMRKLQGRGLKTGNMFDVSNHDLILVHRSKEDAEETIASLFQTSTECFKVESIRTQQTVSEPNSPWMILWHHSLRDDRNKHGLTLLGPTKTSLHDLLPDSNQTEANVNLIWFGEDVEMRPLYHGLYSCLNHKLDRAILKLEGHGMVFREEVEKLKKLRLECAPPNPDGKWEIPSQLRKKLISFMPKIVKSFCVEDSILTVYTADEDRDFLNAEIRNWTKDEGLILRFKKAKPNVGITRFCRQERALYSPGGINERKLGSVGLYSRLLSRRDESTNLLYSRLSSTRNPSTNLPDNHDLAAITNGIFAQSNMRVFITPPNQDGLTELGICVWPDHNLEDDTVPINDIAVVKINPQNLNALHEAAAKSGNILRVYEGDRQGLQRKKVYKVGASSGRTHGYIIHPNMTVPFGDDICDAIIVQAEDSDTEFCEVGDSGSASKCRASDNSIQAVSLIFSDWSLDEDIRNAVLTTSIADGIDRFQEKTGLNLVVDNDFGLH